MALNMPPLYRREGPAQALALLVASAGLSRFGGALVAVAVRERALFPSNPSNTGTCLPD
jgi:hypothetical protein